MTSTFRITNGDIAISQANGRPFLLTDKDKLRQDVRENLDSEDQFDGTGAGLEGIVGTVGDTFSLRAEISRRLNDSFDALRQVQDSIQRVDRTRAERVSRVAQVVVVPLRDGSTGDYSNTDFAYRVDLLSLEGASPVTVTGRLVR